LDKVWILPEAEGDLESIWLYTEENWGIDQAYAYHEGLTNTFMLLSENLRMGQERSEFTPTVFSHHHASHIVIYVPYKEGISIVRVLHESMDIDSRLSK
jgi:toxin ParE1/3/4